VESYDNSNAVSTLQLMSPAHGCSSMVYEWCPNSLAHLGFGTPRFDHNLSYHINP